MALILTGAPGTLSGQEPAIPDIGEEFAREVAPQVIARVEPVPMQHRTGAAFLANWTLRWTGKQLVEGHLEYVLADQQHKLAEFKSDPLVLDEQERRFSTMLPALESSSMWAELVVRPQFVTEKKTYTLGEFPMRLPQRNERTFIVASADAWGVRAAGHDPLEKSLRLERFHPRTVESKMMTIIAHVPLEQFAEDPLEYCVYDVVLLVDEAFSRLREKQLAGLSKWVEAGGSAMVVPGTTLDRAHLDFLNDAADSGDGAPTFLADDAGKLIGMPPKGQRKISLFRKGLGRVAVLLEDAPRSQVYDDVAWKEAVWFLWKGRDDVWPVIRDRGEWPANLLSMGEPAHLQQWQWQGYRPDPTVGVIQLTSGGWLMDYLVPEKVQMMPMSVMGAVLILYLLVVGPVDYFLLGLLKLRRFTWVLFPVVTLAFAVFTLSLSERYMATDDQRRAAVFLDVVDSGRIARENRIELLLMSSHGEVVRDVKSALFTQLEGTFGESTQYQQFYQSTVGPGYEYQYDTVVGSPKIEGVVPDRYRVLQNVTKWTPQLNRLMAIAPEKYEADFNWDSITAEQLKDPASRNAVYRRMRDAFSQKVSVHALNGTDLFHFGGRQFDTAPPAPRMFYGQKVAIEVPQGRSFFHEVCVAPQRGLFTIVSQISPTAGDNFEDLGILDPSDRRRWVLIVGIPRGNDLLFYRKHYVETL